jgi:hypothetical protein
VFSQAAQWIAPRAVDQDRGDTIARAVVLNNADQPADRGGGRVTSARQVLRQHYHGEVVAQLDLLGGLEVSLPAASALFASR